MKCNPRAEVGWGGTKGKRWYQKPVLLEHIMPFMSYTEGRRGQEKRASGEGGKKLELRKKNVREAKRGQNGQDGKTRHNDRLCGPGDPLYNDSRDTEEKPKTRSGGKHRGRGGCTQDLNRRSEREQTADLDGPLTEGESLREDKDKEGWGERESGPRREKITQVGEGPLKRIRKRGGKRHLRGDKGDFSSS